MTTDPHPDAERCEGCGEPATHSDVEGVPLCEMCYDVAPLADSSALDDVVALPFGAALEALREACERQPVDPLAVKLGLRAVNIAHTTALAAARAREGALEAALSAVLETPPAMQAKRLLDRNIGTATDEGRAWLAAHAALRPARNDSTEVG